MKIRKLCLLAVACSFLASFWGFELHAVEKWTNPDGKVIEAEFVDLTNTHVELMLTGQGKSIRLPYDKLSAESLEKAKRLSDERKQNQKEAAAATAGKFKIGEQWIPRGVKSEVITEIEQPNVKDFLSKSYGKPTTKIVINAVVPEHFDSGKEGAFAVVCHAPGRALSAPEIRIFSKLALEKNALVLAVDGEHGNPGNNDLVTFRSHLLYAALMTLMKDHPVGKWQWIHVGGSGGCGNATYCAMYMMKNDYRVAGCYLNVGNYSPLMWESSYKLKTQEKKQLKLYYSFGENDKVCTPDLANKMLSELKRSPYTSLKVSWHTKGHGFEESQYKEALEWLMQPAEQ